MFYVIFESTTPPEAGDVSATYYDKLQNLLKTQPGFIKETPFSSVSHENGGVLVANFEDEDAAHRWRKHPTHLRIQSAAREKIFTDYRVRAGPLVSLKDPIPSIKPTTTARTLTLIEEPKDIGTPLDLDVLRSGGSLAQNVTDIATYDNDEKIIHIVSWVSEEAALDFAASEYLVGRPPALCIRVMRDYGKINREEAPR